MYRGKVPKKSNNKDNTVKSSAEFEKRSPQSGIVRWGGLVESRDYMEVNGWSLGTMVKTDDRQKVVRQKESSEWRMDSTGVRHERTRRSRESKVVRQR